MEKSFMLLFFGVFLCVVNTGVLGDAAPDDNEECVSGDSLACVQFRVFRMMKTFFDMNRVDLIGGLSIVKEKEGVQTGRSAKSLEIEKSFDVSDDFETRQTALETFAVDRVMAFLTGRSLQWDPSAMVETVSSTVRSLGAQIPTGVQKLVTQLLTEGRGRKKNLQKLLPFLIGIKMKLGTVIILAALGIALIAKKAILASFISLAVSIYILVKKLLAHHHHHHPHHPHHHAVHEGHGHHIPWAAAPVPVFGGAYSSPVASYGDSSGGWDAASSYSVNDDTYGSHSSPVAHKMAFGGQKPKRR